MTALPRRFSTLLAATALAVMVVPAPSHATTAEAGAGGGAECFDPAAHGASAKGGSPRDGDHRDITAAEQREIAQRTAKILAAKGKPGGPGGGGGGTGGPKSDVPVYVHVMAAANGAGNVSDTAINNQIAVLDQTFAPSGIGFTLAGIDRFYNDQYHQDRRSTTYRAATRQGGKNALNIWLVDFSYLGIATFPWDYAANPSIDGIRVHYDSLPGGGIANYNQGKTATHEAGHWFGLYHTFQGGCTATNDEVGDTPAQASSTTGCPEGRDSCSLPGLDPIHNYMDYSYDQCYTEFSPGQTSRMDQMWTAYRL